LDIAIDIKVAEAFLGFQIRSVSELDSILKNVMIFLNVVFRNTTEWPNDWEGGQARIREKETPASCSK